MGSLRSPCSTWGLGAGGTACCSRVTLTPFGRVGVKIVWDADGRAGVSAEYDDCKRAARKAGVPLRDVVRAAEEAARDGLD